MQSIPYVRDWSQGRYQKYVNIPQANNSSTAYDQASVDLANQQNNQARAVNMAGDGYNYGNFQRAYSSNGNFSPMGGVGMLNAYGRQFNLPNALVQWMAANDSYNAGRTNYLGDFVGGGARPQGMNYVDAGAAWGRINRINQQNPQFFIEGSLNPYKRQEDITRQAVNDYNNLIAQPRKEQVINGQMTRSIDNPEIQQARMRMQQEQAKMRPMTQQYRGEYEGGLQSDRMMESMKKQYKPIAPTYSNLPIQEKFIK